MQNAHTKRQGAPGGALRTERGGARNEQAGPRPIHFSGGGPACSCSPASRRPGACSSARSCRGTGCRAGRPCWPLRCWWRPTGWGCAAGGLLQDRRGPRRAGLWGTALLAGRLPGGGFGAAGQRGAVPAGVQPARGAGQRVSGPGSAGLRAEMVPGPQGLGHRRDRGGHGAFGGVFLRCSSGAWADAGASAPVLRRWGCSCCWSAAAGRFFCRTRPPPTGRRPPAQGLDCRQMLRTRQYKLCVAAVALSAPPVLLFSPEILAIAADRGLPEPAAPFCVVLGSAASAAGRLLCPAVSDMFGPQTGAVRRLSGFGRRVGGVCLCRRLVGAGLPMRC